ncbi:MAG: hypothetical protein QF354_01855 [Candidatus Thalassarchaeum sp.]|nr:hypothetical protein [Candidatus Thalassarchaeum sp.]
MTDDDRDDRIIREGEFRRGINIDLSDIDISPKSGDEEERREELAKAVDEALGEFYDPFEQPSGDEQGAVQQDGSVPLAPERDIVTEISVEGERGVNWALMISMIVVYSAIGVQAGLALSPLLAIVALLLLAGVGFALGERWVPDPAMKLLGVTWVVISMKVMYGLAIELNRWDYIGMEALGVLLLLLVGVNVLIAYRHNHDAIAAQSTLVLLAIASTAGSVLGESGVAGMILLATLLMHGLALHRQSGNLAALGVAASNLWIGMHAITGGFEFGSLRILALDDPLLLFLLLMTVTGINATMAARFAHEENWFSQAFKALGLGMPGLWGVSVSMGMVGALLAVTSNREDTGYALGMVAFLGAAFGGSYLSVRGVDKKRVAVPLGVSAFPLVGVLIAGHASGSLIGNLDSYELFTILATIVTGFVLLRDQDRVTDRVLWLGAIVVLTLLVILVPVDSNAMGGDGGKLLLGLLGLLHIGTAVLAVQRESPSLAGVTVLLPWSWVLLEELVEETVRTLLVANDVLDPGSMVDLEPVPLGAYLALSCVLMIIVNVRLGESGVNLAARFLGVSEISASIRDSGALQLWSLGWWLPLFTLIFMSHFGGFTAISLLLVLFLLTTLHIGSEIAGIRIGDAGGMAAILAVAVLAIQWRHGMFVPLTALLCLSLVSLMLTRAPSDEKLYTNGLGLMSLPLLLALSGRQPVNLLESTGTLPEIDVGIAAVMCSAAVLATYLPRAGSIEKLLNPALAALWLLVITIALSFELENKTAEIISLAMFVVSSLWLVARGELRAELKSVSKRDARIEMAAEASGLEEGPEGGVATYDPRLAELEAKRSKQREKSGTDDLEELYVTDVSHKPMVVLAVLSLILGVGIILGLLNGTNPLMLVAIGIFATALISLARSRTKSLELELPHIMGLEMPIAMAIAGLVAIHVVSHIGPGSSNEDLLDMAVLVVLLVELVAISLIGQDRLLDRIPVALDWIVMPLLAGRILGAVMVEALPYPLTIDPFGGDILDWGVPWMVLESVLVLVVLVDVWVDRKREKLGRDDWKGSSGRGSRSLFVVMLSFGPAGILAVASAVEQGWRYRQPWAIGLAVPAGLMALYAIGNWYEPVLDVFPETTMGVGLLLLALLALTVPLKGESWSMMLAADSHLLIIIVAIAHHATSVLLPVLLIVLSTTVWVVGILQLRRTLRVWGLVDLVVAILSALIFVPGIFEPTTLLIALMVVAAELGVVSWLGLRNEAQMVKD